MKKLLLIILFNIFTLNASDEDKVEQEQIFKILEKAYIASNHKDRITFEDLKAAESKLERHEMSKDIKDALFRIQLSLWDAMRIAFGSKNYQEFENILKFINNKKYNNRTLTKYVLDFLFIFPITDYAMKKTQAFDNEVIILFLKYDLIDCYGGVIDSINRQIREAKVGTFLLPPLIEQANRLEKLLSEIEKFKQLYIAYLKYKKQYEDEFLKECKEHLQDIPGLSELACSYNDSTFEYYLQMNSKKEVENNSSFSSLSFSNWSSY